MKVNIWSDIRCPFCFVGKKKFEKALAQFPHAAEVEVEWHSFQLDPSLKTREDENFYDYFGKSKGVSRAQTDQMFSHVRNAGKEVDIEFDFENQKVANSLKGHILIQLAKTKNKSSEIEEALFKAQLVEGKNIDNVTVLTEIAETHGITAEELTAALNSDEMAYLVNQDMQMAAKLGINAVPFFVFNDKYGASGAQQPELFLEILEKAWAEYKAGDKGLQIIEGDACDTDGNCN